MTPKMKATLDEEVREAARKLFVRQLIPYFLQPRGESVLAGVLAGEAAFLMAEHSTDAHYFVETFAIVLRAFYVLAMVVMGSMMFDKMLYYASGTLLV